MNELHLFAGAGGGILCGMLLGHRPVCAVEIEEYPRRVLLQRQRDGILPRFPIWDDICTFDGKPWRGLVDVVCGGFPCQDISAAGKGEGITGARSGLWGEMARVIREVGPRFVFVENSPMLTSRGLGTVLGDLAAMGYDARWCVLGACDAGAPHKRDRIWILAADADCKSRGSEQESGSELETSSDFKPHGTAQSVSDAMLSGLQRGVSASGTNPQGREESNGSASECGGLWWAIDPAELSDAEVLYAQGQPQGQRAIKSRGSDQRERTGETDRPVESLVGRVAHGVADRVDRLKAIGNGQVPQCAALAWTVLEGYE